MRTPEGNTTFILGEAFAREVFIRVQRGWLIFPWSWWGYTLPGMGGDNVWQEFRRTINIHPPIAVQSSERTIVVEEIFGASNHSAFSTMIGLDDFFPSTYTQREGELPDYQYEVYPDGPTLQKPEFSPMLPPNNITRSMERLATAMTNAIRSSDIKGNGSWRGIFS